jgi:preprotein translocase SecE subunit
LAAGYRLRRVPGAADAVDRVKTTMATNSPAPAAAGASATSGGGLVEYLRGVRAELKKAEWPSRAEMFQLTRVVLLLILIVAVYCGSLDGLLGLVTNRLFGR